ncbi:MAG: molecular chaperone Tir [Gemmatimonadetes bacterium]|nr:molecular chaperone Tir [Gemmatimonadota bacterium]|tara:strand:+ start:81 stop:479 length:399 start_codon:yes stop_codon:yes gene_type:complete
MSEKFDQVKDFVLDLGFQIDEEIAEEEIVIIHDEERGIRNLVIDCEEDVLVLEQPIVPLNSGGDAQVYRRILQMNRELIYGSFVLNEEGDTLIFRNTLALENLDLNELESSINALSLGLAENGKELLAFTQS